MSSKEQLCETIRLATDMKIDYIIDDIFPFPINVAYPSNIDYDNISLAIETPKSPYSLHLERHEESHKLNIASQVNPHIYEYHQLSLDPIGLDEFTLYSNIIEERKKGFLITNIKREYSYFDGSNSHHLGFFEKADHKIFPVSVGELYEVIKKTKAYSLRQLKRLYKRYNWHDLFVTGQFIDTITRLENGIGGIKPIYQRNVSFSLNEKSRKGDNFLYLPDRITTNDPDDEIITVYNRFLGTNSIRNIFNAYQGIVNEDNEETLRGEIYLCTFPQLFSYEDYEQDGISINEKIASQIGESYEEPYIAYQEYLNRLIDYYISFIAKNQINKGKEVNTYIKSLMLKREEDGNHGE